MSVIQRVANRIQARRRVGSNASSPPPSEALANSGEGVSVSRDDMGGFYVVDETVGVDVERDDSLDHDLNHVAEELFNDDCESKEPRLKPAGPGRPVSSKPWHEASKDVYEQQLELLQDQLMTVMVDKQAMECERGIYSIV